MTTYNTRNPLGSTAVKDLYDNAENLDHRENDLENEEWGDRFGVPRLTWYGIEKRHERQQQQFEDQFQQFLLNSGYEDLGDYGPGLEISTRNQVFRYNDELYRASASLELPYTTTGSWSEEGSLFVSVGDAALRQDLAGPDGGTMLGYKFPDVASQSEQIAKVLDEQIRAASFIETGVGFEVALVKAIEAADRRGGGEVFIRQGEYVCRWDPATPIRLYDNITIAGDPRGTVLKTASDTGDYWGIFGQKNNVINPKVRNVKIKDLIVDQNPSGNTGCYIDNGRATNPNDQDWRQFFLSLYNFEDVEVSNVIFRAVCGVNTITCNGWSNPGIDGGRVRIQDCEFHFYRASGDPDYDNSAIYTIARDVMLTGNKFFADPASNARACMEVHGPGALVANNFSMGYQTGVNIVGRLNEFYGTRVSNNIFTMCKSAIQFWAIADIMLRGVDVTDNTITIDCANFLNYVKGMTTDGTGNANNGFEDINILRNTIQFLGTPHVSITSGPGFDFRLIRTHRRMRFEDNKVIGALSPAFRLGQMGGGSHEDLVVQRNYTEGCGRIGANQESSHMLLTGTFNRARILHNDIADLNATASQARYSIVAFSGTFNDVEIGPNTIRASAGSMAVPQLAASISRPSSVDIVTIPGTAGTGPLIDVLTGQPVVYQGSSAPAGLYRCTLSGTVGYSIPVNATYDDGLNCYVLDGPTNLRAGNYIIVGGGGGHVVDYIQGNRLYVAGPYNISASGTPVTLRAPTLVSIAA